MNRQKYLHAEFVKFIPEKLKPGIIYISRQYSTASHLCCCGCGFEVVTPINPAKWQIVESQGSVSLYPSIGNWSFPCRSHYWIIDGHIRWSYMMSNEQILFVKERDKKDTEEFAQGSRKYHSTRKKAAEIWSKIMHQLRQLFRL